VLVKAPFVWRGVTWGDAIEIAGVYVVLALYSWVRPVPIPGGTRAALLAFAGISYALGHGIHVAANSVHDMLAATHRADSWGLVTLWDERIGHYLVDVGRVAFAIGLTWAEADARGPARLDRPDRADRADRGVRSTEPIGPGRWIVFSGAIAYGFIYFATAVEGQTAPLALPFCAAFAAWGTWSARHAGRRTGSADAPVRRFFTVAAWTALLFFAIWGAVQRGLPEFTKVGIL
jgi:hypothetical protein